MPARVMLNLLLNILTVIAGCLLTATLPDVCIPHSDCPHNCLCVVTETDLVVHCNEGGLTDYDLNLLLKRLPRRVSVLHIDAVPPARSNNFSITRDFSRFSYLRELRLRHGSIVSLGKRIFGKMNALRTLDVSHNRIAFLSHEAFLETSQLEHLHLDHNQLGANGLPASAFVYLPNLKSLTMAYNHLKHIPPNNFYGLSALETLSLDGNSLENSFTNGYFSYMPNLARLSLKHCKFGKMPENLFPLNSTIRSLSLAYNSLEAIPTNTLSNLYELVDLDLSGNYLKNLTNFALGVNSITSLNISYNLLGTYPHAIGPGGFGPLKLKNLDLSHNCFREFHSVTLGQTVQQHLESFYLSGNPLYRLSDEQTEGLTALKHLHLSTIGLEYMPSIFPVRYSQLESLDLSGNPLSSLSPGPFSHMSNLKKLDLSSCRLSSFDENTAQLLLNISSVRLHDNPWRCQCSVVAVRSFLLSHAATDAPSCPGLRPNYYKTAVLCDHPSSLAGRPLATVPLEDIPQCSAILGAVGLSAESEIGILAAAVCSVLLIVILAGAVACSYFWPKTAALRAKTASKQVISNGTGSSEHSELVRKSQSIEDGTATLKQPQERLF